MRIRLIVGWICMSMCLTNVWCQVGLGVTYGLDLYQQQHNPELTDTLLYGTGSVLFNLNIGPKIWVGNEHVSIGLEAQIGFAPFAFDKDEYKGMGLFYFPMMASINFRGLSGFSRRGKWGLGIAAGTQFTYTDLYFRADQFSLINRTVFQTYFGQVQIGLGRETSSVQVYVRYGRGDFHAQNVHIGFMIDQNLLTKGQRRRALLHE